MKSKLKHKPKCLDCDKTLSKTIAKRCGDCWAKFRRKPEKFCVCCGKLLSRPDATKCKHCYLKWKRGVNHPMYGKFHSKETRKKMSRSKLEKYSNRGKGHYNHKIDIDLWMDYNKNKYICKCGCKKYIIIKRFHYNRILPEYLPHHYPPVTEFKKGHISPFKGKTHTELWKKAHSLLLGGSGIPYENTKYGASFSSALKCKVRAKAKNACQICGDSELRKKLNCHHIDYNKKNNKLNNLMALCTSCHGKTNHNRNYWKKILRGK